MNIYSNKIPVFNNWQVQYKPIMTQNIPIAIKYAYSLNFEFFEMLLWSNTMQQRAKQYSFSSKTHNV